MSSEQRKMLCYDHWDGMAWVLYEMIRYDMYRITGSKMKIMKDQEMFEPCKIRSLPLSLSF
jgi:hypothetical protein